MTEESNQIDTQAEEPLSLREELAKQLTTEEEAEEVTGEVQEEDAPSEDGSEEEAEGAESPEEEPEEEDAGGDVVDESDVPNNWNADEKKAFEEIPDEIVTEDGETISLKSMKDVVLNRNEELLKAFNEKAREASAAKKGGKEWNDLLDPYKSQLEANGITPQKWVGSILQSVHALQQNPAAVIKDLIGAYKVSPSDLGINVEQSDNEDDFHGESDPVVAKLETTIVDLQKRLDSFENASVQQQEQSVQDQLATFKNETDAEGNLLRPHFDEARDEMGVLMQTGKAKSLQEAYDKSPTVKSKGLSKSPEDKKLALKKAREEAAKAKKAGRTVRTRSGNAGVRRKEVSLRDELKEQMRARK